MPITFLPLMINSSTETRFPLRNSNANVVTSEADLSDPLSRISDAVRVSRAVASTNLKAILSFFTFAEEGAQIIRIVMVCVEDVVRRTLSIWVRRRFRRVLAASFPTDRKGPIQNAGVSHS